ncbi:hypothetical protein [Mangrovibacterium sp.]|uniref:hypothetical protein n=1 Tax=Mangrovibacterium sp. TaxID=1961364 RepID=UPI003563C5AE
MKELTKEEAIGCDGGLIMWSLIGAAVAIADCVEAAINNPDSFEDGFNSVYSH